MRNPDFLMGYDASHFTGTATNALTRVCNDETVHQILQQ